MKVFWPKEKPKPFIRKCCGQDPVFEAADLPNSYPGSAWYRCKICGDRTCPCYSAAPDRLNSEEMARDAWNNGIAKEE